MKFINRLFGHLKTILVHKYWVFHYCKKAGIPWAGVLHDMSKFSPVEFLEGVKYYQGNKSPIELCKSENGFSKAWLHHRGRNPHHYEYWVDNLDKGGVPLEMPYRYAVEMICDYLAAGKTYMKDEFSYHMELEWWFNKSANGIAMHSNTKAFVEKVFIALSDFGDSFWVLNKENLTELYKETHK